MDFVLEVSYFVCICAAEGVRLFPGSTALNPGAVPPSCERARSTPSTRCFRLGADG